MSILLPPFGGEALALLLAGLVGLPFGLPDRASIGESKPEESCL